VTDGDTNDCSPAAHRKLIDLAAVSSKCVYGISASSMMLKKPERFQAVGPGENLAANIFFGTVKAMHVRLFGVDLDNSDRLTPIIVVAIRGTASLRDWSVNLNHNNNNHTQAGDFLVIMSHFVLRALADGLFRVRLQKRVPTRSMLAIWSLPYNLSLHSKKPSCGSFWTNLLPDFSNLRNYYLPGILREVPLQAFSTPI